MRALAPFSPNSPILSHLRLRISENPRSGECQQPDGRHRPGLSLFMPVERGTEAFQLRMIEVARDGPRGFLTILAQASGTCSPTSPHCRA